MIASNSHSELLLTSAGPTTEAIKERLLAIALVIKQASQLHDLRILRVADGWQKFDNASGIPFGRRIENRAEAAGSRLWSSRYIGHILGKATVTTEVLGGLQGDEAERLMNEHDLLLIPGGNTWQTIKGLKPHEDAIRRAVENELPYIGESAGSIVAGLTTRSAMLPPADVTPRNASELTAGLGLVDFDIAVHAAGYAGKFAIPGPLSKISSTVLRTNVTPQEQIDAFMTNSAPISVEVLTNAEAISVTNGVVERI